MEHHQPQPSSIDSEINLFTLLNDETDLPYPSLQEMEQTELNSYVGQQQSQVRANSSKKLLRNKTPSEVLKNNLLRIRQNKRVNKLKQLTSNNIDMFLRIKAQTSHYQFKDMHKQLSCQILPRQPKVKTEANPVVNNVKNKLSRCQSVKPSLLSRCTSLKKSILRSKEMYRTGGQNENAGSEQLKSDSNKDRFILFKNKKTKQNKQNQFLNGIKSGESRCIKTHQIMKKVISQKLGYHPNHQNQKTKIIIHTEGNITTQTSAPLSLKQLRVETQFNRGDKVLSQRRKNRAILD